MCDQDALAVLVSRAGVEYVDVPSYHCAAFLTPPTKDDVAAEDDMDGRTLTVVVSVASV